MRIFSAILTVFFIAIYPGLSSADNLRTGVAAFEAGNYPKAVKLLKPLADIGNPEAQVNIGFMYEEGRGLPQDYS